MALLIDTETSGLPDRHGCVFGVMPDYKLLSRYDSCRLLEIATILCNEKYEQINTTSSIIRIDSDVYINPHAMRIHEITYIICQKKGIAFEEAAAILLEQLMKVSVIITHNANFDISVLKSELYRYQFHDIIAEIEKKRIICTMELTKPILNISCRFGIKSPNMKEMYDYFIGKECVQTHRAGSDVSDLLLVVKKLFEMYSDKFRHNLDNNLSTLYIKKTKQSYSNCELDKYLWSVIKDFNRKNNIS